MSRTLKVVRRVAQVSAASIIVELAVDAGAVAAAEVAAPFVGGWVLIVAAVIVAGTIPVLALNVGRVAVKEWRLHHPRNVSENDTSTP